MKLEINSKSLRLVMLAGLGLAVVVFFAAAILGLSNLSAKSRSMVNLKVKSQTADSQLSNLEIAKKQVEQYSYFKDVAKTVIPSDKDQAEAVVEIYQIANQAGISIQSITFPASTLGLSATTTSTTTAQDATTAKSTQAAITQAKPVSGIPGLYSLALVITNEASKDLPPAKQADYPKMLDFFRRIENNRRTAEITDVDITPANDNQPLAFTLTINVFIKP